MNLSCGRLNFKTKLPLILWLYKLPTTFLSFFLNPDKFHHPPHTSRPLKSFAVSEQISLFPLINPAELRKLSCNCTRGQGALRTQMCDEAERGSSPARADPEMLKQPGREAALLCRSLFSLLSVRGLTSLFITVTMAIQRPFGVAVAPSVRGDGAIFRRAARTFGQIDKPQMKWRKFPSPPYNRLPRLSLYLLW